KRLRACGSCQARKELPKGSEPAEPALNARMLGSTPQPETADQALITVLVDLLQVVEQLPALVHHPKQTAARMMVLVMTIEVLGELVDPRRQEGDLHLGRAGIGRTALILGDDLGFLFRVQGH